MNRLDLNRHIGRAISHRRKIKKLSREQFAKYIGMSVVSVSNIERGKNSTTTHILYLICSALNCDPTELFPKIIPADYEKVVIIEERNTLLPVKQKLQGLKRKR